MWEQNEEARQGLVEVLRWMVEHALKAEDANGAEAKIVELEALAQEVQEYREKLDALHEVLAQQKAAAWEFDLKHHEKQRLLALLLVGLVGAVLTAVLFVLRPKLLSLGELFWISFVFGACCALVAWRYWDKLTSNTIGRQIIGAFSTVVAAVVLHRLLLWVSHSLLGGVEYILAEEIFWIGTALVLLGRFMEGYISKAGYAMLALSVLAFAWPSSALGLFVFSTTGIPLAFIFIYWKK